MNKKNILQSMKVLVLALVLSLGINYAFSAPIGGGTPPLSNVDGPLNVGTSIQIKNGDLSVNGFLGTLNAAFMKSVGIGTATPGFPLDIKTSSTDSSPMAFFENNSAEGLEIRHTGNSGGYGIANAISLAAIHGSGGIFRPLAFATSNAVRMFISTNGNVGIGTTNPLQAKLDVNGAIKFGNQTVATLCNPNTYGSQRYNSISNVMEFCSNNDTWMPINTNTITSTNLFGGTYTIFTVTFPGHNAGDCDIGNPLNGGNCACPSGFSSYTMAQYTKYDSGNNIPFTLKGCYK
jgi:hypothetical protein